MDSEPKKVSTFAIAAVILLLVAAFSTGIYFGTQYQFHSGTFCVFYHSNGGEVNEGFEDPYKSFDENYRNGTDLFSNEGKEFLCWNTEPDGTGTVIFDDDRTTEKIYIYAIWCDDVNKNFTEDPKVLLEHVGNTYNFSKYLTPWEGEKKMGAGDIPSIEWVNGDSYDGKISMEVVSSAEEAKEVFDRFAKDVSEKGYKISDDKYEWTENSIKYKKSNSEYGCIFTVNNTIIHIEDNKTLLYELCDDLSKYIYEDVLTL